MKLLLVITGRRWARLVFSLRSRVFSVMLLLGVCSKSTRSRLLTSLHGCIPLFTPMLTMSCSWWRRSAGVTLIDGRRGSVTVESALMSASLGMVLVVGRDVDCFVLFHIGCRGDNVESVDDSWDLGDTSVFVPLDFHIRPELTQIRNQRT
jgi:hypothetical protein